MRGIVDQSGPHADAASPQKPKYGATSPEPELGQAYDIGYVVDTTESIRARTRTRIYLALSVQLAFTTAICAVAMGPLRHFLVANPWIGLSASFLALGFVLFMVCARETMHKHPIAMLGTFTTLLTITVAGLCALYAAAGMGIIVFEAFVLTVAMFFGLTAYAAWSKQDFSFLGGFLSASLWVLIAFSLLFSFFPPGNTLHLVYAAAGVIIFSLYVLYDTDQILHKHAYGIDDWALGALTLYLDFINLFLYILQLLSRDRR
eukprot:TRINITY_DN71500_c0_g1_i1.p1 TRINITY_DN71500_c0_g1~~TRINITY_DN71500_c0_g1_i1.p1  ORF type:complete len:290 (+),score=82.91 TRINITY_DN71500_c0_g1_i1:90-872(+)